MYSARPSSVLIVEDDDDVRDALADVVGRAGYRVSTAPHGRAAIDQLDGTRPDAVLLDLMMPVTDGWSVLRHLDSVTPRIPVVVVSAVREPALPRDVGFVAKPLRGADLLATLGARCPPTIIEPARKVDGTLHVCAGCSACDRARAALARVLAAYDDDEVDVRVLVEDTATPRLVLRKPLPLTVPGPFDTAFLNGLFGIAEVQRRR